MADQAEIEQILSTVDRTTFENDDLGLITDALSTCVADWKKISIRLGLPRDKINEIERDHGRSSEDCWEEALILWLAQNYNTTKYPFPSWWSLLKVIAKIDNKLFKSLASEHKSQGYVEEDAAVPAPKPTATAPGPVSKPTATGGGGATPRGSQKDRMTERITDMRQLRMLEYTKNGEKKTINIISKAAHRWTDFAGLIAEGTHVLGNLRDQHRGNNEEAFKQLLTDYFIEQKPSFGYTQDWYGMVKLLNDARLGTLASDVEEAIKSQSSQ